MASIQDLPEELLALILGHLERSDAGPPIHRGTRVTDHVAAVRATNRRLARLADPLMRCIVTEQCSTRPTRPSELARWACKVARHPDRARFVKEIHFTRWPPSDTSSKDFDAPSTEEYVALVQRAGLSPPWVGELLRGLSLRSDYAHLALLLLACPELEVFHGRSTLNDVGPLLQAVFAQCLTPSIPSLPCLWSRVRQIEFGSEWSITAPDEVLPLLQLPRLHRLTVRRLGGPGASASIPEHKPRRLRPIDLIFDDCFLNGSDLAPILAACKPRSLHVRWLSIQSKSFSQHNGAGRCAAQLMPMPLHEQQVTSEATAAILEHAPLLEHLHLDTTDLSHGDGATALSIGAFAGLKRLRTLCLSLEAFIVDHVCLPASLSRLGVLDRASSEPLSQSILDCLNALAAQCPKAVQLVSIASQRPGDEYKNEDGRATVYSTQAKTSLLTVGHEFR